MKRASLVLLPLLGGCLEFGGVDMVIDLSAGTATVTWQDFRGESEQDVLDLVEGAIEGDALLSVFPRATVVDRALVEDGDTLDVRYTLSFERPAELGVGAWTAPASHRICPPVGLVVTRANATARDADGCAIWDRRVKVLRVEMAQARGSDSPHLLGPYRAWREAGSPRP